VRRPWCTAPIWKGFPAVIVAGGESVSVAQIRAIGMARAADKIRVIAVNDAVYPCWFADIAYAADARWWVYHRELPDFQGMRLSIAQDVYPELPKSVDFLRNTGREGFNPEPDALRTGDNGGHQAVQVAAHLGSDPIYLVGFDMHGAHWFGDHPKELQKGHPKQSDRVRMLEDLGTELARRGFSVLNATPRSAVKRLPRVDIFDELAQLENGHGQ
jgi:hypothetical protein